MNEETTEQQPAVSKSRNNIIISALMIILPAITGVVTNYINQNSCQAEKLSNKKMVDSLIVAQYYDQQQCQKTIRAVLKTQQLILDEKLDDIEKVVNKMPPSDTVLVQPSAVKAGNLLTIDSSSKKNKKCPVCPATEVKPNKVKAALKKEIGDMKDEIKKISKQ